MIEKLNLIPFFVSNLTRKILDLKQSFQKFFYFAYNSETLNEKIKYNSNTINV